MRQTSPPGYRPERNFDIPTSPKEIPSTSFVLQLRRLLVSGQYLLLEFSLIMVPKLGSLAVQG
jgi:hypothetical protein